MGVIDSSKTRLDHTGTLFMVLVTRARSHSLGVVLEFWVDFVVNLSSGTISSVETLVRPYLASCTIPLGSHLQLIFVAKLLVCR